MAKSHIKLGINCGSVRHITCFGSMVDFDGRFSASHHHRPHSLPPFPSPRLYIQGQVLFKLSNPTQPIQVLLARNFKAMVIVFPSCASLLRRYVFLAPSSHSLRDFKLQTSIYSSFKPSSLKFHRPQLRILLWKHLYGPKCSV